MERAAGQGGPASDGRRERWVSKIALFMHLHVFADAAYVA
jgi:hypothetical protein